MPEFRLLSWANYLMPLVYLIQVGFVCVWMRIDLAHDFYLAVLQQVLCIQCGTRSTEHSKCLKKKKTPWFSLDIEISMERSPTGDPKQSK